MKKVTFELKRSDHGKVTTIQLIYFCDDGRLKFYTGESIDPSLWPDKVPSITKAVLNRLTAHVNTLAADMKIKGDRLTKEILKASLNAVRHSQVKTAKGSPAPTGDYFDAMACYVDKMEDGSILTPKNKRYAAGTIKTFRFTISVLKKFRPKMTASSVNMETYAAFIRYCHQLDYATNYIGAQIKNWKTLGRLVGGNPIYDSPDFKKIQEDSYDIYLDEKEITALMKLKLKHRELVVRDWFVLDCYTGLRVSDLTELTKKNLHAGLITIANEKTDEKVVIPVNSVVQQILDRWKGFPPAVSDQELNRIIKKVAEKAGIDQNILFTITKGGQRHDEYLKKWQMISNHTARRSFITNARKNKVPDSIVMKLAGIKSPATLQKYDKLSAGEAAQIAADHSFFK